ncbi:MAG: type II CRISPR-associated endonuclease Cas1 [Bacteroidetes bacterium]|nr:type II CRISPR-associated endonuclease Cas1 [Bacteroidota bacterium]
MIKRTLYFGNPSYLSLNNGQLVLRLPEVEKNDTLPEHFKKEAFKSIPVEDIGIVVLDHKQITITQALIEALLENNVALITCDSTHHPTGLMLPLCGNTIQNERFRSQLDATEPLKKQLWAQTVSQKIKNQAAMFGSRNIDNNYLVPLYRNVKSGDTDNCEATAAAYYWGNLFSSLSFGEGREGVFKRFREGLPPNNYLNYGYALLRATMARSIVGAGLLPTLGIFHHNRYNAYCLADDLMEPYRPYVDKVVYTIIEQHGLNEDISKEIKTLLLSIPVMDVLMDGEKSPLMNATQRTAVSLVKCFDGEQRKLLYPEFI